MLNIIYINASFKRLTVLTVNSFIFATPSFFKHTHYIYYYIYIYIYNKNFIQVLHTARKKLLTVRTVGFLWCFRTIRRLYRTSYCLW